MAAPHVSGAIALLLCVDSELTVAEIRDVLTSTAVRDGRTGSVPNSLWGWGKLDVAAAVEHVMESTPEPPPPTSVPVIELAANPVSSAAEFVYSVPAGVTIATLRIYDVSGTLLYEADLDPARGSATWPLRTDRGEWVASGLYLYVLVTDQGVSQVGKLVIAR